MLAMQYTIELPSDLDMSVIRQRVDERSKLFDHFPGMAHKSFILNEEDRLYAPFYVWHRDEVACEFLLDDLFKGVISSFSRPRVRTWNVLHMGYGNRAMTPTYAVREADTIPAEESLHELALREREKQHRLLQHNPEIYFHTIALDAERWELIRFSLWSAARNAPPAEADQVQTYELLHVSEGTE